MNPSAIARAELSPSEIIQADKSDKAIGLTCIALLLFASGYWVNEYQHRDGLRIVMESCMVDHGIGKREWYSPAWKELRGACWTHARQVAVEGR